MIQLHKLVFIHLKIKITILPASSFKPAKSISSISFYLFPDRGSVRDDPAYDKIQQGTSIKNKPKKHLNDHEACILNTVTDNQPNTGWINPPDRASKRQDPKKFVRKNLEIFD